ncbi:MAG: hypothetical protein OEY06_03570 [Gammaproteobacteria bacterium]|nr:hypothetical protein [Gammaproteobacteria bacterium]
MKKILPIISTTLILTSLTTQASNLLLEAGLHFGGDELASVGFAGGSSESIEAGGLISLSAGLVSEIDEGLKLRTTIGIKFDSITASNGDLDFTRYPVSAMLFKNGEVFNAGIGATYHLSPEFESTGFAGDFSVSFDNAFGFVAEVDYKLGEKAYVGLKATIIDYEIGSSKIDGNSFGVVIGTSF